MRRFQLVSLIIEVPQSMDTENCHATSRYLTGMTKNKMNYTVST